MQGSVSLLSSVYLLSGFGESELLSSTKPSRYTCWKVERSKTAQGAWSCRRDKRQSGVLDLLPVFHIISPKYQQWGLPGEGPTVPLGPLTALLCQQLPAPGSGQVGC